jgi:TetR/AcrR family transcriptional regulator, transcriptional repressor for nem operon
MKKGETTKLDIIQRAAPIFNQQGYSGASIADIMRATGLQKGGIYNHFETKEQLAIESFRYAVQVSYQRYTDALKGHQTAESQLFAFIKTFQRVLDDPPIPGGCPLLNTAVESDDAFPELRRQASQEMQRWHRWIARIIRNGINRGEIRSEVEAKAVATVIISCLEGGLTLSKLHRNPIYLQQSADHLQSFIQSLLSK